MLVVAGMLVFASTTMADKKFAHSKSLDMSFTAIGEPWCKPDVRMDVAARDAAKFETSDYDDIIRKLGHVLVKECPQATTLSIKGDVNGEAAWEGTASKARGWKASRTVAETAGSALPGDKTEISSADGQPARPEAATAVESTAEAATATTARAMPATDETKPATAGAMPATGEAASAGLATQGTAGTEDAPASLAKVESPKPETAPEPELQPDEGMAAPGAQPAEPADSPPPVAGMRFPDCDTLFKWAAEMYELDKNTRGGSYAGGRYDGKTLLSGLKDEHLVPVYGQPINAWSDDDLDNWQEAFVACHKDLQKRVKGIRGSNRYQDPLYKLFNGGQGYLNLLGMRRGIDDEFTYAQLIRHQIKVYGEYNKAVELRASQMKEIDSLEATNESIQKVSLMAAEPQLKYLSSEEQQAHRMALNMQLKLLRERLRQAQLRAQRQADIDSQFNVLSTAPVYDRVRFYATLVFDPARLEGSKINFEQRNYYGGRGQTNPLNGAIQLTHPAQHFKNVKNGVAQINAPMYMLVKADDNEIESPYRMKVDANGSDKDIDGWMLVKAGQEFHVKYDDGMPLFEISVEDAVACKSDMCTDEMNAGDLMQAWYKDEDMKFTPDTAKSGTGGKAQ
jgi:hypothetical protein